MAEKDPKKIMEWLAKEDQLGIADHLRPLKKDPTGAQPIIDESYGLAEHAADSIKPEATMLAEEKSETSRNIAVWVAALAIVATVAAGVYWWVRPSAPAPHQLANRTNDTEATDSPNASTTLPTALTTSSTLTDTSMPQNEQIEVLKQWWIIVNDDESTVPRLAQLQIDEAKIQTTEVTQTKTEAFFVVSGLSFTQPQTTKYLVDLWRKEITADAVSGVNPDRFVIESGPHTDSADVDKAMISMVELGLSPSSKSGDTMSQIVQRHIGPFESESKAYALSQTMITQGFKAQLISKSAPQPVTTTP